MKSIRQIIYLAAMASALALISACGPTHTAAQPDNPPPDTTKISPTPTPTPPPTLTPTPTPTSTPTPPPVLLLRIPGTFRTQSILTLTGATQPQQQRVADAMWDFYDGKFTFDSNNVAANLYPLIGNYTVSGTTVSFRAANSFSAGTATIMSATVEGTVDLTTAILTLTVASNDFGAATINGQPQGGGNSAAIRGQIQIGPGSKIPPHYTGPEPGTYPVTIHGTVNGIPFTRNATLYVAKSAGGNPIDTCLISGFPAGLPDVGAIRFVSNTVCFPGASNRFDMGAVTVSGPTITVRADPTMEATQMNQFTASNSLFSCLFSVQSGTMRVTVADGSASGSIDVSAGSCGGGRYQAHFG